MSTDTKSGGGGGGGGDRSGGAVTLALAALSATTAVAFDRVFRDGSYLLPALGAALIPHAIGWLGRRRRWHPMTAVVASLVALGLYASWTAVASTTFLGVPGSGTPHAIATTLRDGLRVMRTGIAPVSVTAGAVLLVVIALWIMATSADALAFAGDAPLGAIVPSLVVFVVASSLGSHDLGIGTSALYLGAALTFLAVCHRDVLERRRSWFAVRTAAGRVPTGHGRISLGVGAGLATVAILTGLFIAPLLPGAHSDPLLRYKHPSGGAGRYESSVNPLVDLAARLGAPSTEQRFTVESPNRLYWREVALDRFDGSQWTLESSSRAASQVLGGFAPSGRSTSIRQRYRLTGMAERWLPAAYEPIGISLANARILPESRTLFNADQAVVGLDYSVDSRIPPAQLTPAQIAATSRPLPEAVTSDVDLPDNFPASVRRLARHVTAGAATPYDRAVALRNYFTGGAFTYDLAVPPGTGNDAMEEFLTVKRGFCQQFAGTFAAMARSVGLPSRVVVGYNPGTYDADAGLFRVTDANAHAWAEVWLAGVGWTLFEPTPAGPQPGATDAGIGLAAGTNPSTPTATTPTTIAPGATTPTTAVSTVGGTGGQVSVDGTDAGTGSGSTRTPDRTRWIAFGIAAVALALVAIRVGRRWARRARRRANRRRGTPRAAVVGAWAEALDRLDENGMTTSTSNTPREVLDGTASRSDRIPDAEEPLERLADATARAMWSASDPAPTDAARAWSDLEALERALRDHTPRPTRIRRTISRTIS